MDKKRLYTPQKIKESIARGGLKLTKSLGQNFLTDGNIVRKIVDAAGISKNEVALEIGPGIGTLTEELALRAKAVIAVEIDRHLIPVLQENLAPYDNIHLVHADILQTDVDALIETYAAGHPVRVVANLPYYITTPILTGLLERGGKIKSITAMMQKEVAERLTAGPGESAYGSLSVFTRSFADARIAFVVPKTVFLPPPKVVSAVVHMALKEKDERLDSDFFLFVRKAFSLRRKTLVNALSYGDGYSKDAVRAAIVQAGLSESIRAEALSAEQLYAVYTALRD